LANGKFVGSEVADAIHRCGNGAKAVIGEFETVSLATRAGASTRKKRAIVAISAAFVALA